ncbi:MAG: hypothetical protein KAI53_01580 [Candidatus Aenigmarchaeota archaeon]|nr:hypothetical protein [Candidatus Aenigmarchaeota archaeon]
MPENEYNKSLFDCLPIPKETQAAIIKKIWTDESNNCLMDVIPLLEKELYDTNGKVDSEYIEKTAANHTIIRNSLLSGNWNERYVADNRPPYIHQIPQYGDSDFVEALRWRDTEKNWTENEKVGPYIIETEKEILIPEYGNPHKKEKITGTKVVVQVGDWYGGYSVLFIPNEKSITPQFKTTPTGIDSFSGKSVETDYTSLHAFKKIENVNTFTSEGLLKAIEIAHNKLGFNHKILPEIMHNLYVPEKNIQHAEPFPHTSHQNLFEEITRKFPTNGTYDEKNTSDLKTANNLLFHLSCRNIPDDDLTKHIIYACLSEPENLERMKIHIYKRIKKTLNSLKNIPIKQIDQKLTEEKKQTIINECNFAGYLGQQLYIPPNMELTLGNEKAQAVINNLGMPQFLEDNQELWKEYLSGEQIIPLNFFKNPEIILDGEDIDITKIYAELFSNKKIEYILKQKRKEQKAKIKERIKSNN